MIRRSPVPPRAPTAQPLPVSLSLSRRGLLRRLRSGACGGLAAGVSVACLPGTSAPAAAPAPKGMIEVWGNSFPGGNWTDDFGQKILREFEAKYPGISVDPLVADDTKFLAAATAGTPPDLHSSGRTGYAEWGINGVVRALDDRMKGAREVKPDRFIPLIVEDGSWRGKTYGIYFSINAAVFVWNKEMYQAAGFNPEQPPDTWEDFATAITKTTKQSGGEIQQLGYHPTQISVGTNYWNAWLWALGGKYLSDDGSKVAFNSPQGLQALEWMQRLVQIQGGWNAMQAYTKANPGPGGLGSMFLGQKVAHYTDSNLQKPLTEQYTNVRFGMGNLPKSPAGKRASYRGGAGLVLPTGAKNPDAAWQFVEFKVSPDIQARWGDFYWRLPTTKAGSASPLFVKNDPLRKVAAEVATYSQRVPAITPAFTEVYAINGTIAQKVLDGTASPRDALNEGARLVQIELDKWAGR